jgi:hypothetical protein
MLHYVDDILFSRLFKFEISGTQINDVTKGYLACLLEWNRVGPTGDRGLTQPN